nr:immunoglobulin light chain junction region [Macaca mulatta]
CRHYYSTPCSF